MTSLQELPAPAINSLSWLAKDGAGELILFVHPANLSGGCWSGVAGLLSDGFDCVAVDLRGHGGSDRRAPYAMEKFTDDAERVMLEQDAARVHLVGASMGAAVVVELAARHPALVATVTTLGGAFLPGEETGSEFLKSIDESGPDFALRQASRDAFAAGAQQHLADLVFRDLSVNDGPTVAAIWRAALATDVRPLLAALAAPCLAIVGAEDRTCPPDESVWFAGAAGCGLTVLPDVGHLPMYEAPSAVAGLLREHIERNTKRSSQQ
ncbi:3-oxoadipate enol-lactonase [Mesorhizobium soli]|uniref:alpha/beta fold hydrolase n=1 Tax=Pseudaminobacter soli (ex Li et al. 2025) TaxID=1295366 RepID=UPI002474D220|nr:alpha/beta hydrolase [Mesorhizobium soli]MDH6233756.1 3-oxoadipate enol-lactonase [Mesorhizobium soli]